MVPRGAGTAIVQDHEAHGTCKPVGQNYRHVRNKPFVYGALFKELSRLGYVEGDNLIVERYSANGQTDHFDELARVVVSTHPDVIVHHPHVWL